MANEPKVLVVDDDEGARLVLAEALRLWSYDVTTVAKSERGLEETLQGRSFTPRWPVSLGAARIEVAPTTGRRETGQEEGQR